MRDAFDRRVVPEPVLALVRSVLRRVPAHLGGGAALSGAYLAHRLSRDLDLVCHRAEDVRTFVRELPLIAEECGARIELVRDAGTLAAHKDAGIDPGVLAWLLGQFPVRPLPKMLDSLTEDELLQFRDDLRERFRRLAVPAIEE